MKTAMKEIGWDCELKVQVDANATTGTLHRRGLGRLRHLEVEELWLQREVFLKKLNIEKVKGTENTADMGTRSINKETTEYFMGKMNFEHVEEYSGDEESGFKNQNHACDSIASNDQCDTRARWADLEYSEEEWQDGGRERRCAGEEPGQTETANNEQGKPEEEGGRKISSKPYEKRTVGGSKAVRPWRGYFGEKKRRRSLNSTCYSDQWWTRWW